MSGDHQSGVHQIERRMAAALASGGTAGIDELDLILTDAAAEVLALRAELLRVNRSLAAVLDDSDQELETLDRARNLAGRRSELSTRWEHLSELLKELRAGRDRLAAK
jgi:recombinational DNA repair ATPase RecF